MSDAPGPFSNAKQTHYDPDEHLHALHRTLSALSLMVDVSQAEINRALFGDSPPAVHIVSDHWTQHSYLMVSYSHAASAAFAAMFEGTFRHEFGAMCAIDADDPITRVSGHRRSGFERTMFWNPVKQADRTGNVKPEDNVQEGAIQILEALDLMKELPADFSRVTKMLFAYRNNALHNGYEWIVARRNSFAKLVREQHAETWFEMATIDGQPWTITMSDCFIQKCFDTADQTVGVLKHAAWKFRTVNAPPPAIPPQIELRDEMVKMYAGIGFREPYTPIHPAHPRFSNCIAEPE